MEFVDKFYEMNPAEEDILFDSTYLDNGMVVIVADSDGRAIIPPDGKFGTQQLFDSARAYNRWMTVSNLLVEKELRRVSFIGTYSDGTKRKHTAPIETPWFVKIATVPRRVPQWNNGTAKHIDPLDTSKPLPTGIASVPVDGDHTATLPKLI